MRAEQELTNLIKSVKGTLKKFIDEFGDDLDACHPEAFEMIDDLLNEIK